MSKSYCLWLRLLIGYQLGELSLPFLSRFLLLAIFVNGMVHISSWCYLTNVFPKYQYNTHRKCKNEKTNHWHNGIITNWRQRRTG